MSFIEALEILKKYWWIGLVAFIITITIQGSNKTKQILKLQEETHQEETKLLQEAHAKELREITERLEQFEKDKKELEEKHAALREEMKKKKTQIIKKYIVLWQDNMPDLKKELETLFDIEEYKPEK